MKDMEYMLTKISRWEKLPVLLLDSEGQAKPWKDPILDTEGWYRENADLKDHILKQLEGNRQTVYVEQEIFAYAAVEDDKTGERCILGPAVLREEFHRNPRNYRNLERYLPEGGELPCCSPGDLVNCAELLCFAIYHEQPDEREALKTLGGRMSDSESMEWEALSYEMQKSEEEQISFSYRMEQQWASALEHGEEAHVNYPDMISRVGKMAGSGKKQMEYAAVASITLAARAAIRGGVSPSIALELSDMWTRKLEQCKDAAQIYSVSSRASRDFLEHVRAAKSNSGEPVYIRECRDFIARHRTGKIDLNAMAGELHISYGYLSRKFREVVGMTLQQYILKEKIRAAANMIHYSDLSLSEIASYLEFSSQSHMGTHFKKEYHMTPSEYRRKVQ